MASPLLKRFANKRKPYLMAHRGNRAAHPENTLAAFRRALADGADILETDLHLSRDGELVCIHDDTVNRTTNGQGAVAGMTLRELKSLHTLDAAGSPTEERIPTLAELAALLPGDTALALELKSDHFLEAAVCEQLGRILEEAGALERTFCISFSMERLRAVRATLTNMPIGWITMTRIVPDKEVDLIGAFWPVMMINPWYTRTAHARGMLVCPLDPTPDARLRRYLRMGVDAVLSDNPGQTRAALNRLLDAEEGRAEFPQ